MRSLPHSLASMSRLASVRRLATRCRIVLMLAALSFLILPARADYRKLRVNRDSSEGQYLDLVQLEADGLRKVQLLEQYLVLFPTSEPVAWVYGELQDRYRRLGQLDKAISAGEKLMALEPDNVDVARLNWRMAESLGNVPLTAKWQVETAKAADKLVTLPLPSDPEERKIYESRLAYARQFARQNTYTAFTQAMNLKDPAQRLEALDSFVQTNPGNPYMVQIEDARFTAYRQTDDLPKAMEAAERILARDDSRDDAMLFIAEVNFRGRKNPARTLTLADKVVAKLSSGEVPAGYDAAQRAKIRRQNLTLASYIAGSLQFQAEQWASADRSLRAVVPGAADPQLRATVLNSLGWANYRMNAVAEAIRFYTECAAIPGPLQDQAAKNVKSIKAEFNLP